MQVTGKKSELVQRLVLIQQEQMSSDDDTTTISNQVDEIQNQQLDPSLNQLPEPLIEALVKYTQSSSSDEVSPKLLPIQQKSYQIISKGNDAVIFSPTGTGKSLAFILPLASRLYEWKHDGSLDYKKKAQKQRFIQQQRNKDRNDSFASSSNQQVIDPAEPSILVVEPSRELARQVGKIWGKFHPTAVKSSKRQVVTVYGGVPMARHAAMLSSKTDVVIGTPGRIRELIREKYLSTSKLRSIVLDEGDTLLNFKDNPEVEWLLDGMRDDYQLVLASATVNKRVEKFVGEVMELEVGEEGYVIVEGDNIRNDDDNDGIDISVDDASAIGEEAPKLSKKIPAVRHWSMSASTTSRVTLTSDLIVTMEPRRVIVFAPSKAEVESVAQELTERMAGNDVSIHILHGDMVQQARSRTIIAFSDESTRMTRVLVATDVAARGLDLPAVDLVLQYGVPRLTGKDGTFDSELYIHRTGRAGRFGNTRTADAIVLYDRTQGEATTLNKLQEEMKGLKNIDIEPRQLPSPNEVMEASYNRVVRLCDGAGGSTDSLVQYFADKLSNDVIESKETNEKESMLIHRLASAMAALSGLDGVVPNRSLLTANPKDRTIRVWSESSSLLSPSEITPVLKSLGSGKLGRISICSDGSAVFDLSVKRAEKLLKTAAEDPSIEWIFELPDSLPAM